MWALQQRLVAFCIACLFAQCLSAEGEEFQSTSFTSTFFMVMVHDHCRVSVVNVRPTKAPPSKFLPIDSPSSIYASPKRTPHHFREWTAEHGMESSDWGMIGLSNESKEWRYAVTFVDEDGAEHATIFPDPRLRMADGIHGRSPRDEHELFHKPTDAESEHPVRPSFFLMPEADGELVWVPLEVRRVKIYCHNLSAAVEFDLGAIEAEESHRRQLDVQATTTPPRLVRVQTVGPETDCPNFIFLSDGYTAAEEGDFNETIQRVVRLLEDKRVSNGGVEVGPVSSGLQNMHLSVTTNRYWSFFNVFSVFQVSPEKGVSYPGQAITVNDNLGCYHPATTPRALACVIAKSQALAAVAPPDIYSYPDKSIIVVIANSQSYGGTGIFRQGRLHLCHFFSGYESASAGTSNPTSSPATMYDDEKYASLINHETGHAFGNLFDEYDIGISEPTDMQLQNCQAPGPGGGVPNPPNWQRWITLFANAEQKLLYQSGITASTWGVVSTPLLTCGFSNYYKSNTNCMMNKISDFFMCPVCREATTVTEMTVAGFSYQWPRFPLPDQILILPDDPTHSLEPTTNSPGFATLQSGVMLHLPKALTAVNGFDVRWFDDEGNSLAGGNSEECPQCLLLSSTVMGAYNSRRGSVITIYANITDNTVFISPEKRASVPGLRQTVKFRVKVLPLINGGVNGTNITAEPPIASLFANFGRSNLDGRRTYQQCLWSGAKAPLCHLSFTAKTYDAAAALETTLAQYDQWVLYVVGGIGALFLLLWLFAANYYTGKSKNVVRPIFRTEFTGCVSVVRKIMMGSAVLFMLSSLGTMGLSVWVYLQTTAIGKIIVLAGMILATGLYVMAFIGFWAVSYRSKKLVLVNGGILIFGLLLLCGIAGVGVTIGQEITDNDSFWTKQLESLWKLMVRDAPENACAIQGMLQCTGFFVSCISNIESTVYCPINCDSTNTKYAESCQSVLQHYIHDNYIATLSIIFGCIGLMITAVAFNFYYYYTLRKLKAELRKTRDSRVSRLASQRGMSAKMANKCKALFILKSLDSGDTKALVREFRRIDVDGNGELDRREMLLFFRKALCYKPTPEEIDEIFRVADLDGSGTISVEEFLCMFNPDAIKDAQQISAPVRKASSKKMSEAALVRKGSLSEDRKKEILRRAHNTFGDLAGAQQELQTDESTNVEPLPRTSSSPSKKLLAMPPMQQVGNTTSARGSSGRVRDDLL